MSTAAWAQVGDYVEITSRLLRAHQRRTVDGEDPGDLMLRVRGTALTAGGLGQTIQVKTRIGRVISGELTLLDPQHAHGFGRVDPDALAVRERVREWMANV